MQLLLDMSIHIMTMPTVNMHVLSSKICAHMLINDELFLYITVRLPLAQSTYRSNTNVFRGITTKTIYLLQLTLLNATPAIIS